jgi:DNA-binding CsgD family transcriptional regulator
VVAVAAVLGRRFPVAVVRAVTGLDYRELLGHLHGEVTAQLVAPDDQTPDWYTFHHALMTDAVLGLLDQHERAELARRAADAIEATCPGLPGAWCQACAVLRLDAGQAVAAGRLFTEAGRRSLAQGAAQSAVTVLDRAWQLLAADVPGRVDALETQVYALAEAGLVDRALAAADLLAGMGAGIGPRRRARIHTRLAWVANVDGRTEDGLRQLATARALLGPDAPAEDTVPVDVVAAYLQVDASGPDHLRVAEATARRVSAAAEEIPLPVVACQAWQLLAALVRTRDPDEATACLERSRAIAVRHDLPIWETHALVRLGMDDALRTGGLDRIEEARREASRIGAVTARYQAEVNLATQLTLRGDFGAAGTLIDQVLAATTRLKLVEITQLMLVSRAVLAGHRGRRHDMESALAGLRTWKGDLAQHEPRIHGLAKAFCALLEENRPLATDELSAAFLADERNPTTFPLAGRYGLDLLLGALSGDVNRSRYDEVTSVPASRFRWNRVFALFARAVLAGRDGRAEDAVAAVAEALRAAEPYPLARNLGLRLVGEAALDGGWGTPAEWLLAAERYFDAEDLPTVAAACQTLSRREARRGAGTVPPSMRSAGITAREYEVLRLLGKRLRNKEIAERLHLSLRTVEAHVSSLLTKTGLPNRIELGKYATDS